MASFEENFKSLLQEYEEKYVLPNWFTTNIKTLLNRNITIEDWNKMYLYLQNLASENEAQLKILELFNTKLNNLDANKVEKTELNSVVANLNDTINTKADQSYAESLHNKLLNLEERKADRGFVNYLADYKANKDELFSKNYNDLTNKPTIPTKLSDLEIDIEISEEDVLEIVNPYYYNKNEIDTKLNIKSDKSYVDEKFDQILGEGASETLDTISEIAKALEEHNTEYDSLLAVVGSKVDKSTYESKIIAIEQSLIHKASATGLSSANIRIAELETNKADKTEIPTKLSQLEQDIEMGDGVSEEQVMEIIEENSEQVGEYNIGTSENYDVESDNEIPTTKAVADIVSKNSGNSEHVVAKSITIKDEDAVTTYTHNLEIYVDTSYGYGYEAYILEGTIENDNPAQITKETFLEYVMNNSSGFNCNTTKFGTFDGMVMDWNDHDAEAIIQLHPDYDNKLLVSIHDGIQDFDEYEVELNEESLTVTDTIKTSSNAKLTLGDTTVTKIATSSDCNPNSDDEIPTSKAVKQMAGGLTLVGTTNGTKDFGFNSVFKNGVYIICLEDTNYSSNAYTFMLYIGSSYSTEYRSSYSIESVSNSKIYVYVMGSETRTLYLSEFDGPGVEFNATVYKLG